jgi:hypothetical protein
MAPGPFRGRPEELQLLQGCTTYYSTSALHISVAKECAVLACVVSLPAASVSTASHTLYRRRRRQQALSCQAKLAS